MKIAHLLLVVILITNCIISFANWKNINVYVKLLSIAGLIVTEILILGFIKDWRERRLRKKS